MSIVAGSFNFPTLLPYYSNEIEADGRSNTAHNSELSASPPVNKPKARRPKGFGISYHCQCAPVICYHHFFSEGVSADEEEKEPSCDRLRKQIARFFVSFFFANSSQAHAVILGVSLSLFVTAFLKWIGI